jgi:subtilisin family serine protease/subtilisin-like proprotein convertase family protein
MKRRADLHGPYAPLPSDTFYGAEWPLEYRNTNSGAVLGVNMNVRAAWPFGLGDGVTVAVADTGVELNHPEFVQAVSNAPHFNFSTLDTNAVPFSRSAVGAHGTEVAGLIAADINNARIVGISPHAKLASWVIFDGGGALVSDEQLMDMYQFAADTVGVQNHSWGSGSGKVQDGPTLLERVGIENATTLGRNGLGTVMVRAAGNDRAMLARADDDGYPADPNVIAVGAVRIDSKVTSFSEPGACVLVAAPTGDADTLPTGLFTTDLLGTDGVNIINYFPPYQDLNGYVFNSLAFSGTSSTAPQVSGIVALMLSVNPALGYRDVQHILALSSRHWDMSDPDIVGNGAGLLVGHNLGFGVPDAAHAVRLASMWSNRPSLATFSLTASQPVSVPDDALRVEVEGSNTPPELASIQSLPSLGQHADQPTPWLPLVDVGLATNVPAVNLTNKGALILRGGATFNDKIANAASAGAAFAIIYNTAGDNSLVNMLGTDNARIPAVFIANTNGELLKAVFQTNASASARIRVNSADRLFHVTSGMLCEYVGVRLQMTHPNRGQLRMTLLSPQGTRSVLQRINDDTNPATDDWTYWSTHHFLESSVGDWIVSVADEGSSHTGTVNSVSLIIRGSQITDIDGDGLDDAWETDRFGNLAQGPTDDVEPDGYSNAREQVMSTDPNAEDPPFLLDLSPWQLFVDKLWRVSWPANTNFSYEVQSGTNAEALSPVTNLTGQFPEMEWFALRTNLPRQFFRVIATPLP